MWENHPKYNKPTKIKMWGIITNNVKETIAEKIMVTDFPKLNTIFSVNRDDWGWGININQDLDIKRIYRHRNPNCATCGPS